MRKGLGYGELCLMVFSSTLARRVYNGYRWEVSASAPGTIERLLERFPALEGLPGVRVLKSNHFRTVFHVPDRDSSGASIAKVYRYTSGWDRLRYRVMAHRALQEWTALERFRDLGLPTARALAVADLRRGGTLEGGGLFTSYLGGTDALHERVRTFLTQGNPAAAHGLLARAGKLVREMHDCGVWHRDLHSGNILAERDGDGLFVIDLHTCFFLSKLARWQRRGGVAKLIQSLRGALSLSDIRVLIQAYGPEALTRGGGLEKAERLLFRKVEKLQRKRLKSRSKRCFLPSTQFAVTRSAGVRVFHRRNHPAVELEPLWQVDPPGRLLKASKQGWVAVASLGDGPACVKHRRYSLFEGLQALVESHRLRRAYAGGHALAVRGIPTPQVIALRERRRFGLVREAHLVTEWIEGSAPLDEILFAACWGKDACREAAREKRALAKAVGELVRAVHDADLYPHDFSPQNVIVRRAASNEPQSGPASFVLLTDLDHLYLWQRLSPRGRARNLAEIANLPEGHVTTADRLRGLKAYARGEAQYFCAGWIRSLRAKVLAEHFQVLEHRGRQDLARARTAEA